MVFCCQNCGVEWGEGARSCASCGQSLNVQRHRGQTWAGVTLLALSLVVWLLLVIGFVDEPEAVVGILVGGAIITVIPIGAGIWLLKLGRRITEPQKVSESSEGWKADIAGTGVWALRGAVAEAAAGALALVVIVVALSFDNPLNLGLIVHPVMLMFFVGLPATHGIIVGATIRHFRANSWKGAGLGGLIGIPFAFILIVTLSAEMICGSPGGDTCLLALVLLKIAVTPLLVVLGAGTGLVVARWMHGVNSRIT